MPFLSSSKMRSKGRGISWLPLLPCLPHYYDNYTLLNSKKTRCPFLMGYADEKKHIQIKAKNMKSGLLNSAWHQGHFHSQACQPLKCGQPLAWACNWIKSSPLLAPQLTGREHFLQARDLGLSPLLLQIRQELSAAGWSLNIRAWGPPCSSRWSLLPSCGHPGSALTEGKLKANGPLRSQGKTVELSDLVKVADLGVQWCSNFSVPVLFTLIKIIEDPRWIDSPFRNYNWETI